uniref:long-chain-fatty-acid--CoA ligase n=1 Tax=Parascaris univalens TaxID=6257 RepID=A0A915BKV0_PARUN
MPRESRTRRDVFWNSVDKQKKSIEKIVEGTSPLWIRVIIWILRAWFYVYDCLNYIPYELFNSPSAKLERSSRVKARPEKGLDSPWVHVDGQVSADLDGRDTVDKVFTYVVKKYGGKMALGTRELLDATEHVQPNGRVFEKWELGEYKWESYEDVHKRVGLIAAGLHSIVEGNDPKVVMFAETRADWLITALACMRINLPVVTVYATLGEAAIAHAINETDATILVTSAELLPKIVGVSRQCSSLNALVYLPRVNKKKELSDLTQFRQRFKHVYSLSELETKCESPFFDSPARKEDIALIMYTSGTTGAPKGVLLTNENIVAATVGLGAGVPIICETDTYIGYLPLAHILEVAAELTCLVRGCRIGYSSPLTLHDRGTKIKPGTHGDCWALRPTLMAAVPAIMDRIFKAVSDEVAASPRIMQELFKLNYERKRARYEEGYCSPFLDRIVFKKIRRILGGKIRGLLCGGAALNPETQRFMNICMCCPVIQGYGLTETCGGATVADINDLSTGTVGPPVRCLKILLREWAEGGYTPLNDPPQGEILVSGPNVSPGYWKQPEKTAEDFITINGVRYFATGDIGEMREDGSLLIIDRKKDLVKLQHGEYVSLAKIETALLNCPLVDNLCVYGSSLQAYVVALVVPNRKHLMKIADELGEETSDWKKLCSNEKVIAVFKRQLDEHAMKNKLLKMEIPGRIHLCEEVWTPENGLLTEAMKLKRRPLQEKYDDVIQDLYQSHRAGDH